MAVGETQYLLFRKNAIFKQTLEGISVLNNEARILPEKIIEKLKHLDDIKISGVHTFSFGKELFTHAKSDLVEGRIDYGDKDEATSISIRFIPNEKSEINAKKLIEFLIKKFDLEAVKIREGKFAEPKQAKFKIEDNKIFINNMSFTVKNPEKLKQQLAEQKRIFIEVEEADGIQIYPSSNNKGKLNLYVLGKLDADKKHYLIEEKDLKWE